AQPQQAQPTGEQNDFSAKIAALNNTADTTGDFDKADIEQHKVMGVLAYLSWLVLIPIFAAPKSKFARFHA
ncbi:MAG: zinc ribbon domain-containing protein, partial [Bacillota bacterium]|nr:zinc ribbon domain-containing protein [Bacillota bacterium]